MSVLAIMQAVYIAEIVAGNVPAVAFVWLYHRRSGGAWRHDRMGRHVMAFVAAFAAVFSLITANMIVTRIFGVVTPAWYLWLYLAAFAAVPVVLWWRLVELVRVTRRERRAERVSDEDAHAS